MKNWYTVAKNEISMHDQSRVRAGTIWIAKSFNLNGCAMVELRNIDETAEVGVMNLVKASAKTFFTTPTRDINSAMEDSFLICEAVYR